MTRTLIYGPAAVRPHADRPRCRLAAMAWPAARRDLAGTRAAAGLARGRPETAVVGEWAGERVWLDCGGRPCHLYHR